ncbi:bacterial peptide chain release factor 1 (bRF-1) [Bernardetia litoralis DSM 6794]|uniref:Peptide chain release factor 1 n=1 Tax=Bernardetia litoralis (strain ATCC 23117 / DSM 6794 / NBRC 15988 / NCIMB 1366 / Fx l1 / Sio-4) TaxID=880071 RepID=I4AMZ2_BERLS|nr:peptide chain release factor 1 [Bernardetia litoralis]AFM05327.1 bacterial peptide chain release factor 1 (bRF-1) [Bernardetia litoralis DSM 6794]
MVDKLEEIRKRFHAVREEMMNPDLMKDMDNYAKLSKEYKDLEKIDFKYEEYEKILSNIEGAKTVLKEEKDEDFREMAKLELEELEPKKEKIENEIKTLLIPKDPDDDKNAILEIRAGAGGDEAGIFAGDLYRMYQRFAELQKWTWDIISFSEATAGGYKEIIVSVTGNEAFGKLKYESGVHRVQRVPDTESQGRVHTSAATIAVLPETDAVEINLDMGDIKKDTFRASGAGGQHVNKTESAIRLTHLPSGLVVECQDGRSQLQNYEQALKVLKARLYDQELQKKNDETSEVRRSMVGRGDRSDKIRTYNYSQGRVTDHRINFSVFNLPNVMDGDIGSFIEELKLAENAERLAAAANGE